MSKKSIGVGLRYLLWSKVAGDGTMYGAGDMPTAGAADLVRFSRLYAANAFPIDIGTPESISPIGDDGVVTTFDFGSTTLANGTISLRAQDLDFEAAAQNTKVGQKGDFSIGVQGPTKISDQDIAFILIRHGVKHPVQTKIWINNILPLTSVTPRPSPHTTRAEAVYEANYTAKKAKLMPWGEEIDEAKYGSEGGTVLAMPGPDPINVFFGIGDGTRVEFNFVVDIKAVVEVWANGTLLLPATYTVDTSTSGSHDITFETAPASGAKIHIVASVPEGSLI